MKIFWKRLKAKTPKFFKNIINFSLAISALSTLILTSGLVIPDSILGIITQVGIIAGITSSFIAKLTTLYGLDEEGEVITEETLVNFTVNPDTKQNPSTKP